MLTRNSIVTFTAEDLARLRAQGLDRTDWSRVKAVSGAELEQAVASDPEEADLEIDWDRATATSARPR